MEKMDLKNIDKIDWKSFKFEEIADKITENIDPAKTDLEVYVGLEHLDAEDIHIKRFGTPSDVKGGKLRCYPGDIIFGKRRAYQRKAALVDFEGICSAHAFVFRANPNVIEPKLFPFFLHSDQFMHRMIDISVGGLSPTINWSDLRHQEFLLPPIEQQAQLAELLWAMDEAIEKEREVLEKLEDTKSSLFKENIFSLSEKKDRYFGNLKSKYQVQKVGRYFTTLQYGISEELLDVGEVPILRMNNLQRGKLVLDDVKYYNPQNGELEKFILDDGDILFNRTNSFDLVGKVSRFDQKGIYSFASYLIRIKTDGSKLDSRFLNFYFNTAIGLAKIRKYRTPGVSQSNINAQNIKNVPIPLPPIDIQKKLMDKIDKIDNASTKLTSQIASSKALQKSLINQVF